MVIDTVKAENLIGASGAAQVLRVTTQRLHSLASEGRIPFIRIDRWRFYDRRDIQRLAAERNQQ